MIFFTIENYKEIRNLKKLSTYIEYKKCANIIIYKKNQFLFSDGYIVTLESKPMFYNYSDIIMLFQQKELNGSFCSNISEYLYLYSKFSKRIKLLVSSSHPDDKITSERIIHIIKEKNPNVLVGKTKENKQILLEHYGIKI